MVDHHQVDHQGIVVETTRDIQGTPLSILFDLGATDSFISPSLVAKCKLEAVKQDLGWQMELVSSARVSIDSIVQKCELSLGGFLRLVDLWVIPLGSYDVALGMDWLDSHRASIDCRKKTIMC